MTITKRQTGITVGLLLILATAVVGVAFNSGPAAATSELPRQMELSGTKLEQLKPVVGALRSERTHTDQATLASIAGLPISKTDTVDTTTAIAAEGSPEPALLAKTVGGDELCLLASGLINCVRPETLVSDGATPSVTWNRSGVRVAALTTDGVTSLIVHGRDGSRTAIASTSNAVVARLKAIPEAITWTSQDGEPHAFVVGGPSLPLAGPVG